METIGKITPHLFEEFIASKCGRTRNELAVKPEFGVDVAVIDLPQGLAMAVTSDPLTLIPTLGLQESAWLSVQIIANDMSTTGFAPMYGQFVLNLPQEFSKHNFKQYWDYIHRYCDKIGISITGGHTGFVEGQNSTIAGGGTFFTIAKKNEIITSKGAKIGDCILVTKTCGIEASAVLAMSFPKKIKNELGIEIYQKTCETFYDTNSLDDALIANQNKDKYPINAMHDATEGGVLGAIYELATASKNGAEIFKDKLPIGEIQKNICNLFSLDATTSLGTGSMIITCEQKSVAPTIKTLNDKSIACTEVGKIVDKALGINLIDKKGVAKQLKYQQTDSYWKAFSKASKQYH